MKAAGPMKDQDSEHQQELAMGRWHCDRTASRLTWVRGDRQTLDAVLTTLVTRLAGPLPRMPRTRPYQGEIAGDDRGYVAAALRPPRLTSAPAPAEAPE